MAAPLSSTAPARQAIKDEGNINIPPSGQVLRFTVTYYMDVRNQVQRRKLPIMGQRATGSAEPAPPSPVQQPPPPPPPPAHRARTKRSATGPPPGLTGVHQPPQKQHQAQPPRHRAQHAPQPAPNAHRTPTPPGEHKQAPTSPKVLSQAARRRVRCLPRAVHGDAPPQAARAGQEAPEKVAYIAVEKNVQCQVCNVHLSSELNVVEHNAGKQHPRRLFICGPNGATGNQTT